MFIEFFIQKNKCEPLCLRLRFIATKCAVLFFSCFAFVTNYHINRDLNYMSYQNIEAQEIAKYSYLKVCNGDAVMELKRILTNKCCQNCHLFHRYSKHVQPFLYLKIKIDH